MNDKKTAHGMSDVQLVQGAATLLVDKLLMDTNSKQGSITIGLQSKKADAKPRYYRVVVNEISEQEVEHYQKAGA